MTQSTIELGDLAKHAVTGFVGIVTAKVQYLEGCEQLCLQPQGINTDGEPFKSRYFERSLRRRRDERRDHAARR